MFISVLRNRNYRMLLLGQSVANVGMWMQRTAQDWLVLELTDRSGTALGIVIALQFTPVLLMGPFGGVIADRFDKRQTMVWAQAAVGVCGGALATLALTHTVTLWHVLVLAVGLGMASAIFQPTVFAFLLEIVEREHVPKAVVLSAGVIHAAQLVGPAIAGLMIAAAGTGPVFLVAAATVAGPITALLRLDTTQVRHAPTGRGGLAMFAEGLRYVAREPRILFLVGVLAFVSTFAANQRTTNALMATTVFDKGPTEFGLLGTVMAVGTMIGVMLAGRRRTLTIKQVAVAAAVFCVVNLVSGTMPGYAAFAVALVPVALAHFMFITATNSLLQLESAERLRGRVMALFSILLFGAPSLGAIPIGWLAEHHGARTALILSSAVALAGVIACARLGRHQLSGPAPAEKPPPAEKPSPADA